MPVFSQWFGSLVFKLSPAWHKLEGLTFKVILYILWVLLLKIKVLFHYWIHFFLSHLHAMCVIFTILLQLFNLLPYPLNILSHLISQLILFNHVIIFFLYLFNHLLPLLLCLCWIILNYTLVIEHSQVHEPRIFRVCDQVLNKFTYI